MAKGGTIRIIAVGIAGGIALSALSASAATTDPCKNVSSDGTSQQALYCKAAESAKAGARDSRILWKIWAAAAAVCSYACYQTLAGNPMNSLICTSANAGAGVTDALVTKNFTSALMAIGTAGMSQVLTRKSEPAASDKPDAEKKPAKDYGSCISAATSGIQALTKFKAAGTNEQIAASNTASAQSIASAAVETAPDANPGPAGSGARGGGVPLNPILGSPESADSLCAGAAQSDGAQGFVSCAVASDSTLPSFVNSPKLGDEFKTATGQDLAEFVRANDASGAATLSAIMSGGLGSAASDKLGEVVAQLDQAIGSDPGVPGTAYAQGGGGARRGPASSDDEPDLNELMKSMFGGLLPTDGGGKPRAGVATVIFANQNRTPAALFEDRTISLFDRITYRYGLLGRGMTQ